MRKDQLIELELTWTPQSNKWQNLGNWQGKAFWCLWRLFACSVWPGGACDSWHVFSGLDLSFVEYSMIAAFVCNTSDSHTEKPSFCPTQLHRRTKSSRRFVKPALASQMRLLQGMSTKDWFQHVSKQAHDFAWHFLRSFSWVILSSIRISRVTTSSLKSICGHAQRFQTHQGIGDSTVETRSLPETNYNVNDKLKPDVWLEPCQVSRKKETLEKHGKRKHL